MGTQRTLWRCVGKHDCWNQRRRHAPAQKYFIKDGTVQINVGSCASKIRIGQLVTSAPLQRLARRRQLRRRRALYRLRRSHGRTKSNVVDRQPRSPRASHPVLAACTTHLALAMLVSAAAHEAKSAAPEVARNAAFSTPSRGVAGRSGAELVACKTELLSPFTVVQ